MNYYSDTGEYGLSAGGGETGGGQAEFEKRTETELRLSVYKPPGRVGGPIRADVWQHLSELFNADEFLETGTFKGDTADTAGDIFRKVHTIELSEPLFKKASKRFVSRPNVRVYHGDSAQILPEVLKGVRGGMIFWFDAHFSGGETAQGDGNTPILQELDILQKAGFKDAVILIDDLRHFEIFRDESEASVLSGYPSVERLVTALGRLNPKYQIVAMGDILMAFPSTFSIGISPVLDACTTSRFFDGNRPDLNTVFKAESIISSARDEEMEAVFDLERRYFRKISGQHLGRHYRLWAGLIRLRNRQYREAVESFKDIVETGNVHWRISWYLAVAMKMCGGAEFSQRADESMQRVLSRYPEARAFLPEKASTPAEGGKSPKRQHGSVSTARPATHDSRWLLNFRKNVRSQHGEDGILEKIFKLIGVRNKWCVEFGAWDGQHLSNTWNLIRNHGWSAVMIEGDPDRAGDLNRNFKDLDRVHCLQAWVNDRSPLDQLLAQTPIPRQFDLLSIDIDGDDFWAWQSCITYRPRVVVVETNPTFGSDIYFVPKKQNRIGASPRAMVELGKRKGYELAAYTGVNCIFVYQEGFDSLHMEPDLAAACPGAEYAPKIISDYDGNHFILKSGPWGLKKVCPGADLQTLFAGDFNETP